MEVVRLFSKGLLGLALCAAAFPLAPPARADSTRHLRLTMPRRMLNDRTQTVRAEIVDALGRIDTTGCPKWGTVSAKRALDGVDVPLTVTVFDPHIAIPDNSIRFFFGVGSISFTLDSGASLPDTEIEVEVAVDDLSASKKVSVLASPTFRPIAGTLAGASLNWGPDEIIRVTGNATVPFGSTLAIYPGTLVMVDTTGSVNDGTLITVQGEVSAIGTAERPIHFFSEMGPAAMFLTQSGGPSNPNCWQGIDHKGTGQSSYRYVFLTGAGNGDPLLHPRPPVLRFEEFAGMDMDHCVLVDNNGLVLSSPGSGTFTVRDTVVQRAGIGGEFGNGTHIVVEDSWFTTCGWGPSEVSLDGDLLAFHGQFSNPVVRRCVFADSGDDGIDHTEATFSVQDSIFHGINDKAMSMTDGFATLNNVLAIGDGVTGLKGVISCTHCTNARNIPFRLATAIQNSIIWPNSFNSCLADMDYTITGLAADTTCGTGNVSVDPQFRDPASCDYRPAVGSPALTAGPFGQRIGWLGFPSGVLCASAAQCDDGNVCTDDLCGDAGVCEHPEIDGCLPCETHADCDDGNQCTDELCEAGGTCSSFTLADGAPCDDELPCTADACSGGACAGTAACPSGWFCDDSMSCSTTPLLASFRNDALYAGTQDTWLGDDAPAGVNGARDHFRWDTGSPATELALIRFDALFGSGPGQIPDGSTIRFAELSLNVFNTSTGTPGQLHEAAVDWSEATTTWNDFGGDPGVQPDEIGTLVAQAPLSGVSTIDVTASVARWVGDPASNFGWIVVPFSTDEARAFSSENTTEANRPSLSVTYFAPVSCLVDAECDDRLFCNGVEVCSGGLCGPALSPGCADDGIECTVDSCQETTKTCTHIAFVPGEVPGFAIADDAETTLTWSVTPGASRYDVASGTLFDLRFGGGVGGAACLVDDAAGTSVEDERPVPNPSGGYYYIVRGQNDCGSGTYGYTSANVERIPTAACP